MNIKGHRRTLACPTGCPAQRTLELVGGRWKIVILYHLGGQTLRFSELRRLLPGITPKMLTQQLRELERDGLVTRRVFAEVPVRVEYALSALGRSLRSVVDAMCRWGSRRRPGS